MLSVKEFCVAHNIPIGNAKIGSLISKADLLLGEIGQQSADENLHGQQNRRELDGIGV